MAAHLNGIGKTTLSLFSALKAKRRADPLARRSEAGSYTYAMHSISIEGFSPGRNAG